MTLPLDHLVYAVPDLEKAVNDLELRLGVRATPGGKHPGLGTHNALVALGDGCYLEVIGPDPDQPQPERARPFGIDDLREPRLVTWAARSSNLPAQIELAKKNGLDLGEPLELSRETPDGDKLEWRVAFNHHAPGDGLIPFLIDWGSCPHPSDSAAPGVSLVSLRAEHPNPQAIETTLAALHADLSVKEGKAPALIAELNTPKGQVTLR